MNLYYINKLSQTTYAPVVTAAAPVKTTKKKTSWTTFADSILQLVAFLT